MSGKGHRVWPWFLLLAMLILWSIVLTSDIRFQFTFGIVGATQPGAVVKPTYRQ